MRVRARDRGTRRVEHFAADPTHVGAIFERYYRYDEASGKARQRPLAAVPGVGDSLRRFYFAPSLALIGTLPVFRFEFWFVVVGLAKKRQKQNTLDACRPVCPRGAPAFRVAVLACPQERSVHTAVCHTMPCHTTPYRTGVRATRTSARTGWFLSESTFASRYEPTCKCYDAAMRL